MKLRREGAGRWTLEAGRAASRRIAVVLRDEHWLQFTGEFARNHVHGIAMMRCAWDALRINGRLDGGAKIVLSPGRDHLSIVREFWIDSRDVGEETKTASLAGRVQEAVIDIAEAREQATTSNRIVPPGRLSETESVDLVELCSNAGWPCNRRAEGRVAVGLDVPGDYVQAILSNGRRVSACIEMALRMELCEVSKTAIGTLLLLIGGRVRCVRGAIRADAENESLAIQGQLETGASAAELNQVLAAISVAARLSIREVPALARDDVAEKFLSMRGWSS
jgi:hypothetical protein